MVRDVRYHSQVMADEQDADIAFFLQRGDKSQNLRLNGYIESRRGFVSYQ